MQGLESQQQVLDLWHHGSGFVSLPCQAPEFGCRVKLYGGFPK